LKQKNSGVRNILLQKQPMKSKIAIAFIALLLGTGFLSRLAAQKNQIEKTWYDEKKTCKVQIYLAKDGKYYGKMVWLNEPIDPKTGKPQVDTQNPDPNLRNTPLLGLIMLRGFAPDPKNANIYTGGTVYDADGGKTYCGKITCKGNTLDMRGYLCSFSLFGKTETWTLAEGQ
jgi:uncharacterized protein (DUF2147 family)